ncbi:MAG: M67 family metallopeptidase [Isosphaeraceae bacterium]
MSDIDVRLLQTESLPDAVFPGGRNEAYRVYFAPEVHRALWSHAGEDTSVEVCGVLVGTWQRDEIGPFATIVDSIRGEGATTKFAEVTFTHQTWAKINTEMDTRFADKKIVGWYHTHPDFGIFLSDRDRFIQEHFFSGPGQVAHVIDPLRKLEGVFIWRGGKPTLADHFWVGDRIITAAAAAAATAAGSQPPSATAGASGERDGLLPPPGRLMMYLATFLVGYLLSMSVAAWERQGMIEAEVRSNGALLLLRLGLGVELDRLQEDLYAAGRLLPDARGASKQADRAFEDVRTRLTSVSQRAAIVKERYANTPAVERELTYLLDRMARDRSLRPEATRPSAAPDAKGEAGTSAAGTQPPSSKSPSLSPSSSSSPPPSAGEPKKP